MHKFAALILGGLVIVHCVADGVGGAQSVGLADRRARS